MTIPTRRKLDNNEEPDTVDVAPSIYSNDGEDVPAITELEGTPFEVEAYYRQLTTSTYELKPIDLDVDVTLQQYEKIQDLTIYLQGALSPSYDSVSQEHTLTAEAHISPVIVPNYCDMFIARTPDNVRTLFIVSRVDPLTYHQTTAWRVEIKAYSSDVLEFYSNLEAKVSSDYFYDNVQHTVSETKTGRMDYKREVALLYSRFNHTYLDTVSGIVLGPNKEYDHFLVDFIRKFKDRKAMDDIDITGIKMWPFPQDKNIKTVFDCMMRRDVASLRICARNYRLETKIPTLNSFGRFTGFNGLDIGACIRPTIEISNVEGYYVFSHHFYTHSVENMSDLEALVYNYLSGETITEQQISAVNASSVTGDGSMEDMYRRVMIMFLYEVCL